MIEQSGGVFYQHSDFPDYRIRLAQPQDDAQLLALVSETMPSNGMLLAFQRQPSYFHATQVQYNQPEVVVVVHRNQPDRLMAMMNMGFKSVYVDEKIQNIRYVSDLRISTEFRAKKTLEFLMLYLKHRLKPHEFVQSIVLQDNLTARHILHQQRTYFPQPYLYDELTTFTVSKVSAVQQQGSYTVEYLSETHLPAVEKFMASMTQFYNFLPDYRFSELNRGCEAFWRGIQYQDLWLVLDEHSQIIALFALWDQKKFKQTKVIQYSGFMRLIKPIYNLYAKITSNLILPEPQGCFDYVMAHSVISDPHDLDLFHYCLVQIDQRAHENGANAFCITLSQNDPRHVVMKRTQSHKIHAIHALHSFDHNPTSHLDRSKITYFEVGRI